MHTFSHTFHSKFKNVSEINQMLCVRDLGNLQDDHLYISTNWVSNLNFK